MIWFSLGNNIWNHGCDGLFSVFLTPITINNKALKWEKPVHPHPKSTSDTTSSTFAPLWGAQAYWVPIPAASYTFSVRLHCHILFLPTGRGCTSGHSEISQHGLVCSGLQLSLWESLPGSVGETVWVCDPHRSWKGETDGNPHDRYDQRYHPGVRPGPRRLGKYVWAPGFARHLLVIPGTNTWDARSWFFL